MRQAGFKEAVVRGVPEAVARGIPNNCLAYQVREMLIRSCHREINTLDVQV
jgi:hypothetical protein